MAFIFPGKSVILNNHPHPVRISGSGLLPSDHTDPVWVPTGHQESINRVGDFTLTIHCPTCNFVWTGQWQKGKDGDVNHITQWPAFYPAPAPPPMAAPAAAHVARHVSNTDMLARCPYCGKHELASKTFKNPRPCGVSYHLRCQNKKCGKATCRLCAVSHNRPDRKGYCGDCSEKGKINALLREEVRQLKHEQRLLRLQWSAGDIQVRPLHCPPV